MKTEYRRDLQHSYLVLHAEEREDEQAYPLKMITQNRIPGLLACECRRIDDELLYYYDLTSRISLAERCRVRKVTGEEVMLIVYRLLQILIQMEEYLLSGDSLYLNPEYIYLDAEMKEVDFCYVPGEKWNMEEQFRELMEGILPFLDHQNQKDVMDVYGLYHYAVQEHFSVDGLRNQLEKIGREKEEKEENSGKRIKPESGSEEEILHARELQSLERKRHEEALNAFFQDEEDERTTNPAAVTLGTVAVLVYLLAGWFLWRNFPVYMWFWAGTGILSGIGFVLRAVWNKKQKKEIHDETNYQEKYQMTENEEKQNTEWMKNSGETTVLKDCSLETQLLGREKQTVKYILEEKYPESGRKIFLGEKSTQLLGALRGTADLLLPSPAVSRLHAKLRREGESYYLCDLNSRNGTWVNGRELQAEHEVELKEGDEIKFADMIYILRFL